MPSWSGLTPNSFFPFAIAYIKIIYSYDNLVDCGYE